MTSAIHPLAEKGFQVATDAYEKGRPEYPADAVECLIRELELDAEKIAADIGAGTGKLTKLIVKSKAKLIAIEPVEGMREKFSTLLPGIEILNGSAENLPLADASMDAVVVAQAFHWFDGEHALKEIHRVLKPRGKLGLIWNSRNEQLDWVAKLTQIIDLHERGAPRYRSGEWRRPFESTTLFSKPDCFKKFGFTQSGDAQMVVNRVASISFIAALPDDEKAGVLKQVMDLIATHPQTKSASEVELPYQTDVFICEKV